MKQNIKADKTIGENIRECRKKRGMTQEQLTAKLQVTGCDISRGTLAKIEAGLRHISVHELRSVKAVLEVGYAELLERPII